MPRDQNFKCSLISVCLYNHQDKCKLIFLFNLNQQAHNIRCLRIHLIKLSNSKTPQQKSINSQFSKGTTILQRKTYVTNKNKQILPTNCFKMYVNSNSRLPTQPRLVF